MQIKKIMSILLVACLALSMFVGCSGDAENSNTTKAPEKATASSAATGKPTASPTEKPTPTPVPTENPHASYFDVDAIVTDFADGFDESYITISSVEAAYINADNPFVTIEQVGSCGEFTVPFGEFENVDVTKYPLIAIKYKVSIGNTVDAGNKIYAITSNGGPSQDDGWWMNHDMITDGDWHLMIINAGEKFANALANEATLTQLRLPTVSETGGLLHIGFVGAFQNEADITSYDTGFALSYGDKLVKDKAPTEKDETEVDAEAELSEFTTDFEDGNDGMTPQGSYLTAEWNYSQGGASSKFLLDGDDMVLDLAFDAISTLERLENGKPFTLSFDIKNYGNTATNFGGLILNYGEECNTVKNFYETNGLIADSAGSIVSKSGIGVFFKEKGNIMIYVITHDKDTNKISYISYDFDSGIDFSKEYIRFKAQDDGKGTIKLFANDTLLASVTYADDGMLPAAATTYNERYYRTAKILDKNGTEVASTDSALISYTKAFAFGGRAHSIYLDDITVENK